MRNTLRSLTIAAIFLSLLAIPTNTSASTIDNTFQFSGNFAATNPCNGEFAQGPIDIHIVVTSAQTGNGSVKVNVHHNSHGTMIGNQGNEYQVNRRAKGQFDAISNQYVIDWYGEFIGKGSAPNFRADGQLRVFTNAHNEPIGSQLVMINTSCQ